MKITVDNFIATYEDAVPIGLCEQLIKYYNSMSQLGFSSHRQVREHVSKSKKDDEAIFITSESVVGLDSTRELMGGFNNILKGCLTHYLNEYSVLTEGPNPLAIREAKIQKTKIGGGYHIWHYETSTPDSSRKVLVYCLYLNDVEEGGETEFLYIPKRLKARKGTIAIFPGSFTHAHRGNPPITNEKYLLNGWIEL